MSYRAILTSRATEERLVNITLTLIANALSHVVANALNTR